MDPARHSSEFMSLLEVATFLSISKTSVYRLTQRRELVHYRIGTQLRYKRADIEKYISLHRVASVVLPQHL